MAKDKKQAAPAPETKEEQIAKEPVFNPEQFEKHQEEEQEEPEKPKKTKAVEPEPEPDPDLEPAEEEDEDATIDEIFGSWGEIDGDPAMKEIHGEIAPPVLAGKSDVAERTSPDTPTWQKAAADLGINAGTYNEFIHSIKAGTTNVESDQTLSAYNRILNLSGEAFFREVLKTNPQYDENDINDYIQNLVDTNSLRFKEKDIKGNIEIQRNNYIAQKSELTKQEDAKRQRERVDFDTDLKTTLSKTKSIIHGAITDKDRDTIYDYIRSGAFQKDVVGNVSNLIETAFFRLNSEKVKNILIGLGKSEGKRTILQNLRPKKAIGTDYVPGTAGDNGAFDPKAFERGAY